jgi:hypothetical protein
VAVPMAKPKGRGQLQNTREAKRNRAEEAACKRAVIEAKRAEAEARMGRPRKTRSDKGAHRGPNKVTKDKMAQVESVSKLSVEFVRQLKWQLAGGVRPPDQPQHWVVKVKACVSMKSCLRSQNPGRCPGPRSSSLWAKQAGQTKIGQAMLACPACLGRAALGSVSTIILRTGN